MTQPTHLCKTCACMMLFLILLPGISSAIDVTKKKVKAILIQINCEQNKRVALTKANYTSKLAEVEQDAENVRAKMTADFTDNFSYCTVYYYIDSNAGEIRKKHFDGVLLNADGSPAQNIVISATDSNYLIAYYGYPIYQPMGTEVVKDSTKYVANGDSPYGKGLIINNSKFQQLAYFYHFGYDVIKVKLSNQAKYYYDSKHFDINYFPSAAALQETMSNSDDMKKAHVSYTLKGDLW